MLGSLSFLLLLASSIRTNAQQKADTSNTVQVVIKKVDLYVHQDTINKFIGNVAFQQDSTWLYCDSAYRYQDNVIEAFGDVHIVQPHGTDVKGDYAKYIANDKQAYMKGNVNLTDGKSTLKCEELNYNLGTKVGVYNNGGTLQDSLTTVTSNTGTYYVNTKDVRFTGDVMIDDPQYSVTSDDIGYNTETKVVTFFNSPSTVISGKSVLHARNGTYDSKQEIAHFIGRSSITNKDQYIEADTLNYSKETGYGNATGNVITIDTTQHSTLYCGHAEYYRYQRVLWATRKPVLKQVSGDDSLFMRADTFYSAPIPKPKDTLKVVTTKKGKRHNRLSKEVVATTKTAIDTNGIDSTGPRFFIGYHHVLIYSDSLQGRCDSVSYTQSDSTIRMMYDPVAWSRNSQITGDTILLRMDSGKLKRIFVPNNAAIVSLSGPPGSGMYDQVQGKTITGYFKNNAITSMLVKPNAQAIYYSKDDAGAFLGVNQAESERMHIIFADNKIDRILLEQEVKQVMTPLDKADIPSLKLSRFKWLIKERPQSREELFR